MSNNIVYWKQRNGELISVDNMDINHLRNTLKMIITNREKALQSKPKPVFILNSDIAQSFNNDMEDIDNDYDLEREYFEIIDKQNN